MNALLAGVSALFLYAASAPGMAPQEGSFDRGVRLYEQGKHAESIAPLEHALNRYPEGSNILWNLGLASAAAGRAWIASRDSVSPKKPSPTGNATAPCAPRIGGCFPN